MSTEKNKVLVEERLEIISQLLQITSGEKYPKTEHVNLVKQLLLVIEGTTISQEIQKTIAIQMPELLPLVNGITAETITTFCMENSKKYFQLNKTEILFEIYNNRKEELSKFSEEEKKNLVCPLLCSMHLEQVKALEDPKALEIYNKLIDQTSQIEEEKLKNFIAIKPTFIGQIKDPSEELQIYAVDCAPCPKTGILEHLSNPADRVMVILLADYDLRPTDFLDKFENGLPKSVIDMAIERDPWIVFENNDKNVNQIFGISLSKEQVDLALDKIPSLIENLSEEELTNDRVINAITKQPSVVRILGEKFQCYSPLLLQYALEVYDTLPEERKGNHLNAINSYDKKINDIKGTYTRMVEADTKYQNSITKQGGAYIKKMKSNYSINNKGN